MKVNITDTVKDYKGKSLKQGKDKLIWRNVVFTALNNFAPDEKPTGQIKTKCFQISQKIFAKKDPDLTVDQRSFIIERIEKVYPSPLICGRAREFFEEAK